MKKSIRQILSLLLAAVMVIGFFPVSAVAGEGEGYSDPDLVTDTVFSSNSVPDETDDGEGEETGQEDGNVTDVLSGQTQDGQNGLGPDGQDAEHAPAPESSDNGKNDDRDGPGGTVDPEEDPGIDLSQSARLELKFGEDEKYTLRTLKKVALNSPGLHARDWEEDEEEQYRAGHAELKKTQDDVLAVSFRNGKDQKYSFDTLVEFTLSCKDWKGRPLSELEAMELSLYLTTQDDELGAAESLFNYSDGEPALFFSTNLLADLLLTKPNAAELERRQKEAEEEKEENQQQETGENLDDGHAWGEWTVTVEATCTEDGSRERACSDCDAMEVETIPAGHSWSEWTVTEDATCTEDGSRERACSECDKTEVEVIPAAGHAWDTDDEEAAAVCTVCGEEREAVKAFPIELDGDFWRQGGDGDAAESAEYWDSLFGGVLYTGNWAEDLLTVAVSQIGYTANTENYLENEEGEIRLYTRYGDWYGLPYSAWGAMFVSFCLNYARIPAEAMPVECGCTSWIDALTERGMYAAAADYVPKPGDLVFFDYSDPEQDGLADHVGIVWTVNEAEACLSTVEGALNDSVDTRIYALTEPTILGYGILPDNQELLHQEALAKAMPAQFFEETVGDVTVTVDAGIGAFPPDTRMELTIIEDEEVLNAAAEAVLNSDEPENAASGTDSASEAESGAETAAFSSGNTVKKVSRVCAVDICFYDTEGHEIEPALPVRVTMKSSLVNAGKQADVVHIDEDGAAKIDNTEMQADTVSFSAGGFSTYVIVEVETITTTFTSGDGRSYEVTVTSGSEDGFPEGWSLAVSELTEESETYEEYAAKTADTVSGQIFGFTYLKILDISILDESGCKVQPETPVEVTVSLTDKEAESDENAQSVTKVIHFADASDAGTVVDAEVEGGTVSFVAESFSAYAIVEGPPSVPLGWYTVNSIQELISRGSTGLYLGHPEGYYYRNTTVGDSSRTGISKTKPAQNYPPEEKAAKYYFESAGGSGSQVYAYCLAADGVTRQYVRNENNNSLLLTTDESLKTAFTVALDADGCFLFNNGAWYWNMQGGVNGTRFCSYNNAADSNNKVLAWYYKEVTSDPYALDGRSYGLMNWNGGVLGKGMMSSAAGVGALSALPMTVMTKSDNTDRIFVPNDSDLSMWRFSWVSADRYYITTQIDGAEWYLQITENGIGVTAAPDDSCLIQVLPGTGVHEGEVCLKAGNTVLTYSGVTGTGFSVGGQAGSEWLHLVDLSELTSEHVMTYSAKKVSISDKNVTTGSKVVIYTRSWNEKKKKYEFFAIDHDGTLVPCFETGDSIEWVGSRINSLLWQFTEYTNNDGTPNGYYEFYNQYSGRYLAPEILNNTILSPNTIGLNMKGRQDGQYYSQILAWDDPSYAFAGMKVENGVIVPCPRSQAMDFYIAEMEEIPLDDIMHTVNTVDNTQYGITMKIIDFENQDEMCGFLGSYEGGMTTHLVQGLLSTDLKENGYPDAAGGSLGDLYSFHGGAQPVNHLFIESTYFASGYYEYDSAENFASLKGNTSGDFTVYKELGSYDSGGNKNTLKHGQFFPFNDIEPGVFTSVNRENLYSSTGALLPDGNPRKHEQLYLIKNVDCYFGVELEASFTQTPSGLDAWGHDIIFEFTGDDDFWLYVDGELIIDLGGIHSAVPGSVNFATGEVNVNGTKTTLRALIRSNYLKRNPTATEAKVAEYLAKFFDEGSTVFKDYTDHTMRIFYMERGAGASNLHMRFNLASVRQGMVQLSKTLSGVESEDSVLAEFPYQIWYKTEDGAEHLLQNSAPPETDDYVFYKDTETPVRFLHQFTVPGTTVAYDDVFFLKPGETADISFPEGMTEYRIVECAVNTSVYDQVKVFDNRHIDGYQIEGTDTAIPGRKDYGIGYDTTSNRSRVTYDNHVAPGALRNLTFTKILYDETGTEQITDDPTEFSFRLYLATEFYVPDTPGSTDLPPANIQTYYVKDSNDNTYCIWNAGEGKFVSTGVEDFDNLTDEQKDAAASATSINGTVSRIPAGYTVEVRQILAGTQFLLLERPKEIPDGYSFQKYVYKDEYYYDPLTGVRDTVVSGTDPHVEIRNLKGWGLRVNKLWTDAEYMQDRDPTYFAVFTSDDAGALTLVPDTVRRLMYSASPQSVYWYFPTLPVIEVKDFSRYVIREVTIGNPAPAVEEDGTVTDPGYVNPIAEGDTLSLQGKLEGDSEKADFSYTVHYSPGAWEQGSNVRTDEVTNSRPGLVLRKAKWDGETWLSGAEFALVRRSAEAETLIGTYTSDADGLITVSYLGRNAEYVLTETKTPQTFYGLDSPLTIRLNDDGEVEVNAEGLSAESYILTQASAAAPASLTVKNRPFLFRVLKVTQDGGPLANAHFALHDRVMVDGVITTEFDPKAGYEDLVSGEDGLLPGVDNTLPAGSYALRETAAPEGYVPFPKGFELDFTISENGAVTVDSTDCKNWLVMTVNSESGGVEYSLSIPNTSGAVLPSTGGIGTAVFYAAGGVLMAVGAMLLLRKKRRGRDR